MHSVSVSSKRDSISQEAKPDEKIRVNASVRAKNIFLMPLYPAQKYKPAKNLHKNAGKLHKLKIKNGVFKVILFFIKIWNKIGIGLIQKIIMGNF